MTALRQSAILSGAKTSRDWTAHVSGKLGRFEAMSRLVGPSDAVVNLPIRIMPETGPWTNQVFERLCHSSGRVEHHHAKLLPHSTMTRPKAPAAPETETWVHACLVWRRVASVRAP
jgi:hypothetical protein